MENNTISAHFTAPSDDTLAITQANLFIQKAKQEGIKIIKEARGSAAKIIWKSRKNLKARTSIKVQKEAEKTLLGKLLEYENQNCESNSKIISECIQIAIKICEAVLGQVITENTSILSSKIQNTICSFLSKERLILILNPEEAKKVYAELISIEPTLSINLQVSNDIEKGNARIKTSVGSIDLSWREHFQLIRQQILSKIYNLENRNDD